MWILGVVMGDEGFFQSYPTVYFTSTPRPRSHDTQDIYAPCIVLGFSS